MRRDECVLAKPDKMIPKLKIENSLTTPKTLMESFVALVLKLLPWNENKTGWTMLMNASQSLLAFVVNTTRLFRL